MSAMAAASAPIVSMSGLMSWVITPTLTVHCFSRDGKLAGHGPLFILREWDMKVIRTIGHKPRCKGLNTEQALRACVRQGLLSLQLRTENATKDEIQLLKSVNVLGKRAPSGSLIGAADLLRLLEYFSKRDVAEAFRVVVKRQHEEGVVRHEVWRDVSSVRAGEILHKFKINTDDVDESDGEQRGKSDEEDKGKRRRSKGGSRAASSSGSGSKGKRGGGTANGGEGSRRSKKRSRSESGSAEEGKGSGRSKRRRSPPASPRSMHSSSSGSSLSSLDSRSVSRRRRHRTGHRRHRSRSVSPPRAERRDKPAKADYRREHAAAPAEAPRYNGQYEAVNGGHSGRVAYATMARGSQQPVIGVAQNGRGPMPALQAGRGRGGVEYYNGQPPPMGGYTVSAPHPVGSSPPSYTNGLYTANGRPASYTLSALPPHIQQSLQQYPPPHPLPIHPTAMPAQLSSPTDPNLAQSDGLEVLMQVISDKGPRPTVKHPPLVSSAIGQHPLAPVRGQLVNTYEQAPPPLSSTEQLYLQQQQMQQQVYLNGQSQLSPSSLPYRPTLLPNGVIHKDSPPYHSSNSFSFNGQPAAPMPAAMKKEYVPSSSPSPSAPSPVRISSLPSVQSSASLSSAILSPVTPEQSSTPKHSSVHRPQARMSPANSFNNLSALVASSSTASATADPPITRTLSSNSLSLGLPNSSSVSSLSSLLNGAGGSLSYNALHTSMSMTSLNAADVSDDDDDGDAGIDGILHFDDDIGEGRGGAGYYPAYSAGSGSPLPRVSSIQSLTAAGAHSPLPRIPSNLSTLTSSFLPSPPPSRPGSPAPARTRTDQPTSSHGGSSSGTDVANGVDGGAVKAESGSSP